jgi:hypothetical protein
MELPLLTLVVVVVLVVPTTVQLPLVEMVEAATVDQKAAVLIRGLTVSAAAAEARLMGEMALGAAQASSSSDTKSEHPR